MTGTKRTSGRTWRLLALVCVQLGIAIVLLGSFPREKRDFLIQMTAGRVADLDGTGKLYDPERQILRQSEITGVEKDDNTLLPFNHPPILVPFLEPLSRTGAPLPFLLWTAVTVLLLLLSTRWLTSGLSVNGASHLEVAATWMAALTFFPVAVVIAQGQDTGLLLAGVAAWAVLIRSGRDFSAGLMLSLASIRPHFALGLAVPFLLARRRVAWGFLLGAGSLAAYSIGLVGVQGALDYLVLLRESSIGGSMLIAESRMPNLLGAIHRLGGGENRGAAAALAWLLWIGFVVAMSIRWRTRQSRVSPVDCGLLVAGTVFFVPHIHLHDLAVLMIPLVVVAGERIGAHRMDWNQPLLALSLASLLLALMSISSSPLFDICLSAVILLVVAPLIRDARSAPL